MIDGQLGRTLHLWLVAAALVGAALLAGPPSAVAGPIVVDGALSDWGVTPFTHWVPQPSAMYIEDNWSGPNYPHGGEVFDLEAMYLRTDPEWLYVGLVSSFPQGGAVDPYDSHVWIAAGDLLLDVNHGDGFLWEYAAIMNGSKKGDLYYRPALVLPQASAGTTPGNGPSNVDVAHSGLPIGKATVAWHNYGDLEGYGSPTYGIEAAIPWSALGGLPGESVMAHYTMGCGNDALNLVGPLQQLVPEPVTAGLLLFGGTVLLAGACRRRRLSASGN